VQAQRRRHGGGPQDRQRQPLQGDFLRRQRAQHSGGQANRPPHGAGWHVAAGEGRGSRAGEHPQHPGGAAGAVGGGREGGGRPLRRPRGDRDLGDRVDAAGSRCTFSLTPQAQPDPTRACRTGDLHVEFSIGRENSYSIHHEERRGSSESQELMQHAHHAGPVLVYVYVCVDQIFACKLLLAGGIIKKNGVTCTRVIRI
uniref:Uncharacterized protein n=1 Tax=Triticum urartu TaxID=4572 RepID=A0A8R7RFI8_TRIUA